MPPCLASPLNDDKNVGMTTMTMDNNSHTTLAVVGDHGVAAAAAAASTAWSSPVSSQPRGRRTYSPQGSADNVTGRSPNRKNSYASRSSIASLERTSELSPSTSQSTAAAAPTTAAADGVATENVDTKPSLRRSSRGSTLTPCFIQQRPLGRNSISSTRMTTRSSRRSTLTSCSIQQRPLRRNSTSSTTMTTTTAADGVATKYVNTKKSSTKRRKSSIPKVQTCSHTPPAVVVGGGDVVDCCGSSCAPHCQI